MSYTTYVGLVLNIERQRMVQAVAVARGIAASSPDPLDASWADAVATDASEVDAILSAANVQRAVARLRAGN